MRAMPPSQRTRHARGPQGAVICYLLQAGWRPDSPTSWTTPTADDGQGHTWQFPVDNLTGIEHLD
eukprot:3264574-Pyramimonas_sp.AAC.1